MTLLTTVPVRSRETAVRIIASNDILGTVAPLATTSGSTGSIDGIAELVARERIQGPTLWLDSGDLTGGALWSLTGHRDWSLFAKTGLDAMAVGNHEADEGVAVMLANSKKLDFPLLCANADFGLPAAHLLPSPGGDVGVIGLTSPHIHRLAPVRTCAGDPTPYVHTHAQHLRDAGARWVIVLQHDGVDWWPTKHGIGISPRRWLDSTGTWGHSADAVLGGHTLGAWFSSSVDIGPTFGHAHPFAMSVLVLDLTPHGARVRGLVKVPSAPPAPTRRAAANLIMAAGNDVVGKNRTSLTTATGSPDSYLPDTLARALQQESDADCGFLLASSFFTQAPLDGAVAALPAGPVSRLDVHRLFPFPDDDLITVDLHAGEFALINNAHDQLTDPTTRAGDHEWWNWHRARAGRHSTAKDPRTMITTKYSQGLIETWLDRRLHVVERHSARSALESWFAR